LKAKCNTMNGIKLVFLMACMIIFGCNNRRTTELENENTRLKRSIDSLNSIQESVPNKYYVVCVLEGSMPHKYDLEKFTDWRKELVVSEIKELELYNEDIEYRLLDEIETNYRRKATRFIATTPARIHARQCFTFKTYKEASLKRSDLLNN
jgi:hypothetical protein